MTVTAPRAASSSTWTAAPNDSATTPGRRLRGADLLSAVACTVAGPAFLSLADRLAGTAPRTGTARLEQLLALGCAALGLVLCLAWAVALVSTALWVVAARRGSRHADVLARFSPALLQRLAAAAFGIHVALAPGAAADDAPSAAWLPAPPVSAQTVGDGPSAHWLPDAPSPTGPGLAPALRADASAPTVTVVDGDCLWDLAAAELGPDATVLEVDARWREWHRHNRELIGDDPHVLYTGTVLEVPPHTGHVPPAEDGRP
ncbi:LysM peptidoglycan-binding domain-containing protein [Micrococcus sp. FDAARGOS_333]|uniref:LysM peptidoglycan-binding domain-containing protein n=1 Tax=Micrococcus sp. FDAARGOS_333 TaxID=1930558 RepID=UPI000B4E34DB|nr:hypothetical protein [Micrococcus sp. FDAARGOS_333]PNL18261.1 hypothetical protein CEQ11_009400 [Micrococcus sp. FDAARGOS_333]